MAANVRAWTHLNAFLYVVGRPFPGFVGREGSYPIDLTIAPPARQRRLTVLFRPVLLAPGARPLAAYGGVALVVAVLGWLAALVTGRMPGGLRDIGVAALRYQAQTERLRAPPHAPVSRLVTRARRPPRAGDTDPDRSWGLA